MREDPGGALSVHIVGWVGGLLPMTESHPRSSSGERRMPATIGAALLGNAPALLMILSGSLVLGCLIAAWTWSVIDLSRSQTKFPQRAKEALPAVKALYEYHRHTGSWPSSIEHATTEPLPPGWEYRWSQSNDSPRLFLHGPYHMLLAYIFPAAGDSENGSYQGWRCNCEGTPLPVPEEIVEMTQSYQ